MDFFLIVHRYLRFVILAIGILGVLRALVSLGTREARFMRIDDALSRVFSGALDLQVLVGAVLILWRPAESNPIPWIHPIIMLPAVFISHLTRRFRHRPDRERHRAQLAIFAVSLAIVALGLIVIDQLRLI
jgi:hypothetical protein